MIRHTELTKDVSFEENFDSRYLTYNAELGFLQFTTSLDLQMTTNGLSLVGFGAPISRQGGIDMCPVVQPLVQFEELPLENRTTSQQGKGVGPRLYNTREAFAGAPLTTDTVGVYSFMIEPSQLLDARSAQGSITRRIARHAGRILRSKTLSLEAVVEDVHASYGDAAAVEFELPPLPRLRQLRYGVKNPKNVTPNFMIIRDPSIELHKIGETTNPR